MTAKEALSEEARENGEGANSAPMNTTFVNGLALLEALALAAEPMGVSELGRSLDLNKSMVHRLLRTLAAHGYVQNVGGTGRYEITLKLWELGVAVVNKLDVKSVALEAMKQLVGVTGETAHLSILNQGEVIFIDKVDSPQPVRAYASIGARAPAYCVSAGKVLMAYGSPSLVDALVRDLRSYTAQTITDPDELKAELKRVRQNGYAVNHGEWNAGVGGVAAPIRDSSGQVIAALGLSAPLDRLKIRPIEQLATHVVEAAKAISARMGWSG
ncbi:MAG TPA: IclR family transcriptional regulator [Ramlibacter sp.]|nr:IclR family transcriptional regulator [Ramlibacter sp.]